MAHKSQLRELAIFGNNLAFPEPLHVGRPNRIDRPRFLDAVNRILDRNILTNGGPEVRALEERFTTLTGVKHAIAVCNATLGLQMLAKAQDLKGRIVMPAFTFVATAHAFKWLGLEPVFCDIDPATHNLDPAQVEAALAAGACAVVGVHVWGRLCAPLQLEKICAAHGVPLFFDAAHALGCGGFGRAAGAFGSAEVFSLHATKICHSFEGGMVTTNDTGLAERIRQMRNFGFSGYDQVDGVGINAKLPEVSAAMGLVSLDSLDSYKATNRRNAERYRHNFRGNPCGLRIMEPPRDETSNFQYIVGEFETGGPADTRDLIYEALHAEGALVRRYFHPGNHRLEPYKNDAVHNQRSLPHTDSLCSRVLCFPNGTEIGSEEIDRLCALSLLMMENLPEIRRRLRPRS